MIRQPDGRTGHSNKLNFQLLNSGQANHVTSGPNVDGNTDRVVTIKCVQAGRMAHLDSQCTVCRLVSSRRRLVVLWFFLRIPLVPIENAHDLPSFCEEIFDRCQGDKGTRLGSGGSLRVRPVCRGDGLGSLCGPAIGEGSGAHYLSIFIGMDFIQQRLVSLRDLRLDGGKCARAEFSPVTLFH